MTIPCGQTKSLRPLEPSKKIASESELAPLTTAMGLSAGRSPGILLARLGSQSSPLEIVPGSKPLVKLARKDQSGREQRCRLAGPLQLARAGRRATIASVWRARRLEFPTRETTCRAARRRYAVDRASQSIGGFPAIFRTGDSKEAQASPTILAAPCDFPHRRFRREKLAHRLRTVF